MADVSRNRLRAFVPLDDSVSTGTLSASASSYTQAGPEPGVPVPTSDPSPALTLRSAGVAVATEYEARIARNGYPGRTSRDAGFHWRAAGETAWVGWDRPQVRGWQGIQVRADGPTNRDIWPHVITLRYSATYRGRILAATHRDAGAADRIDVHYLDPGDATWTTVSSAATDGMDENRPTLIELPSGRVICYYWVSTGNMVRAIYSDDGGDTWASYASNVLPSPVDTTVVTAGRLRAAYSAGEVCLLVQLMPVSPGGLPMLFDQYASGDDGSNFDLVTVYEGHTADDYIFDGPEIAPTLGGGFVVAWVEGVSAVTPTIDQYFAYSQRIGSAYEPISASGFVALETTGVVGPNSIAYYSSALATDDDGTVWWVLGREDGTGGVRYRSVLALASTDGGATFESPNQGGARSTYGVWSRTDNADALVPVDYAATWAAGQLVLITRWSAPSGAYDDTSFGALYLGGYSTQTVRVDSSADAAHAWVGAESPGLDPDEWSEAVTGAPSQTISEAGNTCVVGAAELLTWTQVGTIDTTAAYLRVERGVKVTSGGSTAAKRAFIGAALSDNSASEYYAELWLGTAGYAVRDVVAGTILATVTLDLTAFCDLRLEINQSGKITVYHRTEASAGAAVHKWTLGYSGTLTKDATPADPAGVVKWGVVVGTATTIVWRWAAHDWSEVTYALPAATTDLLPRQVTADPVEIDAGWAVSAVDGPAVRGDQWDLPIRYRHGIERIDPLEYPSPRAGWRSTADTAQTIAWDLSVEDTRFLRGAWVMYLDAINWRYGRIRGWNGAAWTTILEIDTATGQTGLDYLCLGDALVVDTGGSAAAGRWWTHAEQVGATAVLDDASLHRVTRSTSGWWKSTGTGLRPELRIDAVTGTETDGQLALWAPRWCGVIHAADEYRRIELVIDAQDTVEGDLRIGVCHVGPLIVVDDPAWGRAIETAANVSLTTRTDGSRSARTLGPPRRTLTMAWPDGTVVRPIQGAIAADPDVLTAAGEVLAAPADTPGTLEGVLRDAGGSATPILWLPSVPRSASTALTARDLMLYGRLTTSVVQETVAGDEDETEVKRVLQVTIEEEV